MKRKISKSMVEPAAATGSLLTAPQACAFLGVKPQTLYAYVSRGWLKTEPGDSPRARLYAKTDLEALKARQRARSGHGAAAATALRWGEPVLDTAISELRAAAVIYRGHDLATLLARATPFESVAELLWSGVLPTARPAWIRAHAGAGARAADGRRIDAHWFRRAALEIASAAYADERAGDEATDVTLLRARTLIQLLAGGPRHAPSVAAALAARFGLANDERASRAIDQALVASADHELNASTFAARVAASTGADLYACMQAGFGALAGARHGASFAESEAFLSTIAEPKSAKARMQEAHARQECVPGFGHRAYDGGDPRFPPLFAAARAAAVDTEAKRRLAIIEALVEAMRAAKGPKPNADLGLVALAQSVGLPEGGAMILFAVGRMAGWTAHVLEQRLSAAILRPRARYVGR